MGKVCESFILLRIKAHDMNTADEQTRKYWIYTAISFVAFVLFLLFLPEFFWVTLPFLLTFGVKAYGAM